jgi:virginiamycin B lyase
MSIGPRATRPLVGALVVFVGIVLAAGAFLWWPGKPSSWGFREIQLESGDIPVGIAVAGDGTVWFTLEGASALGLVRDGRVRKIPKGADSVEPLGLALDASGRAWYTEAPKQRVARASADGSIATFSLATPVARLGRLAVAPDGGVWFAEASLVSVTHLSDGRLTRHVLGSLNPAEPMDAAPFGIAVSRGGHVWATLQKANKLLQISPSGDKRAFDVPTRGSGLGDVAVGADGVVWFVELAANKIGRFADGRFEEFAVSTPSAGLTGLAVAPDGAAWFTELRGHKLGRLHAGAITEYVLPRPDARPFGIAVDAGNNVWYTDLSGWIGRLDADRARVR